MAKYISFEEATKTIGESNMALLVEQEICKRGAGKALALKNKEGKWVSAPLANQEKVMSYLSKKLPKPSVKGGEIKKAYEFTHELVKGEKPPKWVSNRYSEVFFSLGGKTTNIWDLRVPMVLDQKEGGRPKVFSIGCWADLAPKYYNLNRVEAIRLFSKVAEVLINKVPSEEVVLEIENDILRERVMKTIKSLNDPVVAK